MKKVIILLFLIFISVAGCSGDELNLSDPMELELHVEDAKLIGWMGKKKLVFYSQDGKREIFTYNMMDRKKNVVASDAESYFVDPVTGNIFYSKVSEEKNYIQQIMAIVDGKRHTLGNLEGYYVDYDHTSSNAYYKGMYLFVKETKFDTSKGVEIFPVEREYDEELFKTLQESLEWNNYEGVMSDGERLILLSEYDRKIYDFSTGVPEVLIDFSDIRDFKHASLISVSDGKVVYMLWRGQVGDLKPITYIVTADGKEEEFNAFWGYKLDYLDESRMVSFFGPDWNGILYSVSPNTGIKYELDTSVVNYTIVDDRIIYQLTSGDLRYMEISVE